MRTAYNFVFDIFHWKVWFETLERISTSCDGVKGILLAEKYA